MPNGAENVFNNNQNGIKRVPKLAKGPPKTPPGEQGRKRRETGETRALILGQFLITIFKNTIHKIINRNNRKKTWSLKPKGCHNGVKIDAQTHKS